MSGEERLTVSSLRWILLVVALNLLQPQQLSFAVAFGTNFTSDNYAPEKNKTINFLVLGPYPDTTPGFSPSWSGGPAVIAAARLARDHINNRTDILPDYRIELLEDDSGCRVFSKTVIAFAKYIASGINLAGIVGPGCSDAAEILALVLAKPRVNVIQIAPSATSPALVSPVYFTTYRILSSSLRYAETFMELIQHNCWMRIASLYDGERENFQIAFRAFRRTISSKFLINCSRLPVSPTLAFESAIYEKFYPISELTLNRARIIFVFASTPRAKQLMCLAYMKNMVYPNYQWLFHDRSLSGFLEKVKVTNDGVNYTCSTEDMIEATKGIILNNYILRAVDKNKRTFPVNVSYNDYIIEYETYYKQLLKELDITTADVSTSGPKWATTYYDAMWAFAIALDKSMPDLHEKGLSLSNYTLGRGDITEVVIEKLNNEVDFHGVTGQVKFESTRDSPTAINITSVVCSNNYCNKTKDIPVGIFDGRNLIITTTERTFINDTFETTSIKVPVVIGSLILAVTALILIIIISLQLVITVYHSFKPIKATSPNLSHLIFSGCYLNLMSVIVFVSKDTFDLDSVVYGVFCNLSTTSISFGFTLVFGTICAKIWRVYRIFRHFRTDRASGAISDTSLIFFVVFLLFLDVLLTSSWVLFDPWLRSTTDKFVGTLIEIRSTCSCHHLVKWLAVLIAYKGVVTLVLLFLAILNRGIQRKDFKHTKNVSMFVYTVVLLTGIILPLFLILSKIDMTLSFIVMSIFLLATVCCCIAFIFLPPVIPLIKLKTKGLPIRPYLARYSTVSLLFQ